MHPKLERVRRLMQEGYDLEEVESDDGVVAARFSRRGDRVVVTFARHEAEVLLLARSHRS